MQPHARASAKPATTTIPLRGDFFMLGFPLVAAAVAAGKVSQARYG